MPTTQMTLNPGTKLGPYQITAAAGAGGMGEVYRARDTRLERDVAIKVLPAHLSSNPEIEGALRARGAGHLFPSASAGYLLYLHQGNLVAQQFDGWQVQATGPAVPVAQNVRYHAIRWLAGFTLSETGALVLGHEEDEAISQLLWYEIATGRPLDQLGDPANLGFPRISPDGSRVLVHQMEGTGSRSDLWLMDVERGVRSP